MPSLTLRSADLAERDVGVGKRLPKVTSGRRARGPFMAAPRRAKATGILGESGRGGPQRPNGGSGVAAGVSGGLADDLPTCRLLTLAL